MKDIGMYFCTELRVQVCVVGWRGGVSYVYNKELLREIKAFRREQTPPPQFVLFVRTRLFDYTM